MMRLTPASALLIAMSFLKDIFSVGRGKIWERGRFLVRWPSERAHATTPGGSYDTGSSITSSHSVSWSMGDAEGGTVRRNTLSTPASITWFSVYKSRPKFSATFPGYDWLAAEAVSCMAAAQRGKNHVVAVQ